MSAIDRLLEQSLPRTSQTNTKSNLGSNKTPLDLLLEQSNINPDALAFVPKDKMPVSEPKRTLGQKIKYTASDIAKAILSPVATMVARPIQLGAMLSGVSDERINEVSKRLSRGLVAPTPQNIQDVKKDVGRGIQTALTGGLGTVAGRAATGATALGTAARIGAIEGAGYGIGASLEKGNKLLSKETLKEVGIGAAGGAALPVVGNVVGKALGRKVVPKATQVAEEIADTTVDAIPKESLEESAKWRGGYPTDYTPQDFGVDLPTIEAGPARVPRKTRVGDFTYEAIPETPGVYQVARKEPASIDELIEMSKPKPEKTPLSNTQKLKARSYFKEDPEFQSANFEVYEKEIPKYSKEDIVDIASGRKKAPENVPATAFYQYAKTLDTLTPDDKIRLAKKYVVKKSGAELGANRFKAGEIITDEIEYIAQAQDALFEQNVKNLKVGKSTILKNITEIEC